MERYGRASDALQFDPSPEWTGTGDETGLEESVWQLGLVGGESYPQRPNEADCIYYLKTGFCGYGSRCRFNHPRDRGALIGALRTGAEYPERAGQPVCQYYMRTGSCKFGASCKYHHPKQGGSTAAPVSLNYHGYPLRPDEKECSYYVKTGQCKFGTTCKFHHPQPAGVQVPAPLPVPPVPPLPVRVPSPLYRTVQPPSGPSSQQYGVMVARAPLLPGSLVQSLYGPVVVSPVPFSGWNPYQTPTSPAVLSSSPSNIGSTNLYGNTQLPLSEPAYTAPYQPTGSSFGPSSTSQREHSFPERPGQPECQHYMKTGECRFGTSCRYHHPPELIAASMSVILRPMGLPLRPGAPPCIHYAQRGVCKYGPACKFDHSMGALTYSPAASSFVNVPVASIPVGSFIGQELSSFRMPSSMSTSTVSMGLTLSTDGTISQPNTQTSPQSSASSTISHTSS